LIPSIIAIVFSIITKRVLLSLFLASLSAHLILNNFAFIPSIETFISQLYELITTAWIIKTLMFALFVGALIHVIEKSGSIVAFVHYLTQKKEVVTSRRSALFLTYSIGLLIFIESSITSLITGSIAKAFGSRYDISREKVAYICDSTSAPVCSILLFNGWGALLLGLIATQVSSYMLAINEVDLLVSSVVYNFYAYIALLIVFYVIYFDIKIGSASYKKNSDIYTADSKIWPMLIPLIMLIVMVFIVLAITGEGDILKGSGSSAIFYSLLTTLFFTFISYTSLHVMSMKTWFRSSVNGVRSMLVIAFILLFAFVIGDITKELQTGVYIASFASIYFDVHFLALSVFFIASLIAFSTGTSWGTFSIMLPIVFALGIELDANIALLIGAVISGGVFGDHCSVISDTSVISSMASECDHISHVKTQLPYALLGGFIASIGFLIAGYLVG